MVSEIHEEIENIPHRKRDRFLKIANGYLPIIAIKIPCNKTNFRERNKSGKNIIKKCSTIAKKSG